MTDEVQCEIDRLRAAIREIVEHAGPECDYPASTLYMAIADAASLIKAKADPA